MPEWRDLCHGMQSCLARVGKFLVMYSRAGEAKRRWHQCCFAFPGWGMCPRPSERVYLPHGCESHNVASFSRKVLRSGPGVIGRIRPQVCMSTGPGERSRPVFMRLILLSGWVTSQLLVSGSPFEDLILRFLPLEG